MSRFTLQPRRWYSCQFIGDEFDSDQVGSISYSAIKIHDLIPSKNGGRVFKLEFYHANSPEGVRDKSYTLQTIERGETYILARAVDHHPVRILRICEVTMEWLLTHFGVDVGEGVDLQEYLERRG